MMVKTPHPMLTLVLIQISATPNNKLACLVNSDFTVVLSKLKNVSHVGPATTVLEHLEMMLRKLVKQVCTVLEPKNSRSLVFKRTTHILQSLMMVQLVKKLLMPPIQTTFTIFHRA
jgi:hypothetical protein